MALPGPGPNAHVVVTGASSELGAAIARGLATRGYPAVLVDRAGPELTALAAGLPDARAMPADLSRSADRARVRDVVAGDSGVVGLVHAPVAAVGGNLVDAASAEPGELAALLRVSVGAVHELTTAAVGAFVPRGVGAVLTVSSAEAFAPTPGAATRAAAQAFAQSFGDAVHAELRGTGVSMTTLTAPPPDGSAGPLGRALGVGIEQSAEAGVAAMIAGRRSATPGVVSQIGTLAARMAPRTGVLPSPHRWL